VPAFRCIFFPGFNAILAQVNDLIGKTLTVILILLWHEITMDTFRLVFERKEHPLNVTLYLYVYPLVIRARGRAIEHHPDILNTHTGQHKHDGCMGLLGGSNIIAIKGAVLTESLHGESEKMHCLLRPLLWEAEFTTWGPRDVCRPYTYVHFLFVSMTLLGRNSLV
jgi:hypothetical protein